MKTTLRAFFLVLIPALGLAVAGCNLYRVDVQQGNVIQQQQIEQLKPGMDRGQVQELLGTPLVTDPFHPERWDYVYSFKPSYGKREQRRITVIFDASGKLLRVEGDVKPAAAPR